MNSKMLSIVLLLSTGLVNNVFAAAYKCTIQSSYEVDDLTDSASLKKTSSYPSSFLIDRDNGKSYARRVGMSSGFPYSFDIFYRGDEDYSFTAFHQETYDKGRVGFHTIRIREYAESINKPLVYFQSYPLETLSTGYCINY